MRFVEKWGVGWNMFKNVMSIVYGIEQDLKINWFTDAYGKFVCFWMNVYHDQ